MNRTRSFVMTVFAVAAVIICGCATSRVDLVKSGVLTIQNQSKGKVHIAWSSAGRDGNDLLVTGVLTRPDHVGLAIKAHVDVTVLSPDQSVLYTSRTPEIYVPPHVTGRPQRLKRFSVRFPHVPPPGSSVHLMCHSDPAT